MQDGRLAEIEALSASAIGTIAVALAREVARLHSNGVVHGHIRPSQVALVGGEVALDPPDGDGFSKPHDVRSIGELVLWLLSRNGLPADGPLADVARDASALDPATRPDADELVGRFEQALDLPPTPETIDGGHRRRVLAVVVGLVTVVVLALVAGPLVMSTVDDSRPRGRGPAGGPKRSKATSPPSTSALPAQVWPDAIRACPDTTGALVADLDGDGCEEDLHLRDGRLIGAGGAVAISGLPLGPHVTGDWVCSKRSTLALLDPESGRVFVFPHWASPGHDVAAVAVATIARATALVAGDPDGDGCDELRAVTADGVELPIEIPAEAQP